MPHICPIYASFSIFWCHKMPGIFLTIFQVSEISNFIYFSPGFPNMAHNPPPPGVGRVGTRGCLHPKWQQLGCRHSGEVEEIHTFTNCWALNTKK